MQCRKQVVQCIDLNEREKRVFYIVSIEYCRMETEFMIRLLYMLFICVMKNRDEKINAIRKSIEYLKRCPRGQREKRRKPFLRAKHLENSKIFFDIFIPKILQGNINDQYRRLKDIPVVMQKVFSTKPVYKNGVYVFDYKGYNAVVVGKDKKTKGNIHTEYYLLTFFPQ